MSNQAGHADVEKALGTMHFVFDCQMTQEDTEGVMHRLANTDPQQAIHYLAMLVFDLYRKLEYCHVATHGFRDFADPGILQQAGRDVCELEHMQPVEQARYLHRKINELFSEECHVILKQHGGCAS